MTDRLWHDQVWGSQELEGSLRAAWVTPNPDHLTEVREAVDGAEALIRTRQFQKAIALLTDLTGRADQLLPSVSTSPDVARRLLEAHLLLSQQYKRSRRHGPERVESLAALTARRFPSARIHAEQWPAGVIGAFASAIDAIADRDGASLVVVVEEPPPGGCSIFVNGIRVGDKHAAGLPTVPGQSYYASVHCEGRRVSTRRVVPQGNHIVRLHVPLLGALQWTSVGGTLFIPGGDGKPSRVAPIAAALGERLGATEVVLAGIATVDGERVLQLDRINVKERRRVCAVRLPVSRLDAMPMAVQTLRVQTPVVGSPTSFVGEDGIWRTTQEYVASATPPSSYTWTWVSGGAAVGAVGLGLLFGLQADGVHEDAVDCKASAACVASGEFSDLQSERDTTRLLSLASFAASGAFAIGAVAALLLELPSDSDVLAPSPVGIVPVVSGDRLGVGLSVEFE